MGRRRLRVRSHPEEEPMVNLTPLIDVVFSILIVFIVVAPLLELDRVQLAGGKQENQDSVVSVREGSPITLHVHEDNSIWLNQRMISVAQLPHVMKEEKQRYPAERPQVFHDKRAHFGTYQSIKNAAEVAGFEELEVVLKPGG